MSTPKSNSKQDADALGKLRDDVRASIERTDELARRLERVLGEEPEPEATRSRETHRAAQ